MPRGLPEALLRALDKLLQEHQRLTAELQDPALSADHKRARSALERRAALEPVAAAAARASSLEREAQELESAVRSGDAELAELARQDLVRVGAELSAAWAEVRRRVISGDDDRVGSVILEVRAGTGGDEASLWAADLLGVYQKLAARRGWQVEPMELSAEASVGGVRCAVVAVRGVGAWSALSMEAGVHSVKRVPATEAQGRVHTSTASVAVLPEPQEVDVRIDWARDVEEHVTTSQGPGGQNVNKVATAVQLHHRPSGIVIRMQESKSQQDNRQRARRLLLARLGELERRRAHAERSAARAAQIGGGDRAEKVRTYRYKDGIVADERLPDEYPLRDVLDGNLDRLHEALLERRAADRLGAL